MQHNVIVGIKVHTSGHGETECHLPRCWPVYEVILTEEVPLPVSWSTCQKAKRWFALFSSKPRILFHGSHIKVARTSVTLHQSFWGPGSEEDYKSGAQS